jgi:hypothetical protein
LEKQVERYLHDKITQLGGTTYKWASPSHRGVPDRLCVLPGGRIYMVEVKTEAGRPSRLQLSVHKKLRTLGCDARILYGTKGVDEFISQIS